MENNGTDIEEKRDYRPAYQRASAQRLIALKNAFETIYAFAIPSATPDIMDAVIKAEKYLLDMYNYDLDRLEDYQNLEQYKWKPDPDASKMLNDYDAYESDKGKRMAAAKGGNK
jgi:hypothetical protein